MTLNCKNGYSNKARIDEAKNAVIIDKIPANDTQFRSPLQEAECGENAVIINNIPANDTALICFCPTDLQSLVTAVHEALRKTISSIIVFLNVAECDMECSVREV